MYELALSISHVKAQSCMETRKVTIGKLLREVAARQQKAEALVEVRRDGSEGCCWTYAKFVQDGERLAKEMHDLAVRHATAFNVVTITATP